MESLKDIVVIYHGHCSDGFGAAWTAWKKFGDTASYIPGFDRDVYPGGVIGKELYVADFCFSKEVTEELQKNNNKLVIIDHHISSKDTVKSVPGYVFELNKSGAKLAWEYFHPDTAVPELIEYISDGDLWSHKLPQWREVEEYIYNQELTFANFDSIQDLLENNKDKIVEIGKLFTTNFDKLVNEHIEKAILVSFENYEVYACNAPSFIRSQLGHKLAEMKGPFSIVYRFELDELKVSLRGDGSIDVSKIAEKYGGGGHHDAAGITVKNQQPLPFVKAKEKSDAIL